MKIFVNLITTTRLLYTIVLPIFSINFSNTAFIINIIVLFLTDMLDGILARKFKVQTLYGAVMDATADKALSIFLLVSLVYYNISFLLIMVFEIIIALINVIAFTSGKKAYSRLFGKIKMWSLSISIILGYMVCFNVLNPIFSDIIIIITIILQLCAIVDYIISIFSQKGTRRKKLKLKTFKDIKYSLFDTEYYLSIK